MLYESVGNLKGLGQLAIEKVNELRIHTIADIQLHVRHHGKVPIRGSDRIYAMALQALPGNPPSSFKDHRKTKNPYHLSYGERWVDKLKSSTEMLKLCCITNLIRVMMNEAEKLMKGSVHEDDFFIIHDALVLITEKETINWMRQKCHLHRWLFPLNGLQHGTPYDGRPIGNIPEFVPLDNSLNRDIFYSLHFHFVLSHYIVDGEETTEEERNMCLNFSTPRKISRGLNRILDSKMGTPSLARIILDVDLALKAL